MIPHTNHNITPFLVLILYSTHRQVIADFSSPVWKILSPFEGRIQATVSSSEGGPVIAATIPPVGEEEDEVEVGSKVPLQILLKLKSTVMR